MVKINDFILITNHKDLKNYNGYVVQISDINHGRMFPYRGTNNYGQNMLLEEREFIKITKIVARFYGLIYEQNKSYQINNISRMFEKVRI
jgi:mannose/fructose/N-acetylgalactosamine-specific phosphotransferase system component IIB